MRIASLEKLSLEAEVQQLLEDVDTELERLRHLGEFTPEVKELLRRTFLPDRISDTLNIEGVRVSPRLTMAVLDGQAVNESERYSQQEILNVNAANELIQETATAGADLSVAFVRELHRLIEKDLIESAGGFRTEQVEITGSKHAPPQHYDILDLVRELCDVYNHSERHPLVKAVWLHVTLAQIHPFLDGNGRTSRLLQDFALISGGLLPVGVPMSERTAYYAALEAADGGDFNGIVTLIANAELVTLDKAYQVAKVPDRRAKMVRGYMELAARSTRRTEYRLYEIWRRKAEGFINELASWLEDFNTAESEISFRVQQYPTLSLEKWQAVRTEGRASNTWMLRADLYIGDAFKARYLFYAKRHQMNWVAAPAREHRQEVGVFVTSVDDFNDRFEFDRYDDRYLDFRELVVSPDGLVYFSEPEALKLDGVSVSVESEPWQPYTAKSNADVIEVILDGMLKKGGLI